MLCGHKFYVPHVKSNVLSLPTQVKKKKYTLEISKLFSQKLITKFPKVNYSQKLIPVHQNVNKFPGYFSCKQLNRLLTSCLIG